MFCSVGLMSYIVAEICSVLLIVLGHIAALFSPYLDLFLGAIDCYTSCLQPLQYNVKLSLSRLQSTGSRKDSGLVYLIIDEMCAR